MRRLLIIITFILLVASMWLGLTKGNIEGPVANPDSPVRNIIYAHVPSSICSLLCFVVLLVAAKSATGIDMVLRISTASPVMGRP